MELPDYVQAVAFRVAQPDLPGSRLFRLAAAILGRTGLPLDVLNTRLPGDDRQPRRRLRVARRSCPSGRFAVGAIINRTVARLDRDEAFLAIGVGDGFPLLAAIVGNPGKRCLGVDPSWSGSDPRDERRRTPFLRQFESLRTAEQHLHRVDFRVYFARHHDGPIGFCVVGGNGLVGENRGDDPFQRLEASEPHLAENAIVLVENANCPNVREAGLAFIASSRNQYRILLDRPAPHHGGLTFGNGVLLFQLLGRNAAVKRRTHQPAVPALVPAA